MAVVTLSLLATSPFGCGDHLIGPRPAPITLVIDAQVVSAVAFSGSLPAGIAEGQRFSLTVTFLPHSARRIDHDSIYSVYNLDLYHQNKITTVIGSSSWTTQLHQVLLSDDVPFLGDRIAVNGAVYEEGSTTYASFDFRDSTLPYDMLSSGAFPMKREDVKEQAVGTGGGTLSTGANGSAWQVSFVCDRLAVQ